MNVIAIHEQYTHICILAVQKRLKEALNQLESYLFQCTDWNLRNRFEQVQTAYNYMLQYMQQGSIDSGRKKLYQKLQIDIFEIADQTRLLLLDSSSNHYYHKCRKKVAAEPEKYNLNKLRERLESFNDDFAISSLLSDSSRDEVVKQREEAQKLLFQGTWANSAWTPQQECDAQALLQSTQLPENDLCLFTSAILVSLLECFDLRKTMWLLDAYQVSNVQVNQRALVGIVFVLHSHEARFPYYPELKNRMELLSEELPLAEDLMRMQQQILLSQETEKISRKMREDIIPEMMKGILSIRRSNLDLEESDEEKDDKNPDWSDMFENSVVSDKLYEMNELQMEGADLHMTTFSMFKTAPFFNELHNWFYPFDMRHSSVIAQPLDPNNVITDLLVRSGFFCNSDKYSLTFMLHQFPHSQRDIALHELSEQAEDCAEQFKSDTLKKYTERPITVSNHYLHDLYRFFKLNQYKLEFLDIFKYKVELHEIPSLKTLLLTPELLLNLANFHLKKDHWEKTVQLYKEVEKMDCCFNSDHEFYQRMGYALQKLKRYKEAIAAYLKADTIKPDNAWTNRHLATCYRMEQEFDSALEYYRKAEATTPENKNIIFHLGSCLIELKKEEEALNYFFKLDFLENNSIKAWRRIGWCSFVSGKYEQATKYYDKVINQNPLPIDYLNAGHVSWAAGKIEEAIALYRQAVERCENKDAFLDMFDKDYVYLVNQGIPEEDVPLMLDLL